MLSKKIYFQVIIRAILLLLVCFGTSYCLLTELYEVALVGLILLIFICYTLVRYLNTSNRKIAFFFNSVKNQDFSFQFPEEKKSGSIVELNQSLNAVNAQMRQMHIENEQKEKYYQEILKRADIGILLINEEGHIIFSNSFSETLLNHTPLTHTSQLQTVDHQLHELFQQLKLTDRKLFELSNEREVNQLMIKSTPIKLANENVRLITLQNIRQELDEKESDSWTKLISVLIHEIMNAIAPITSISDSMLRLQKEDKVEQNPVFLKGLETIKSQGNDLMSFVQSYRSFLSIPKPNKKLVKAQQLCEKVALLLESVDGFQTVDFSIEKEDASTELFIDEQQITQVLVNLSKNAIESLVNSPNASLTLSYGHNKEGKKFLKITDNGKGIDQEIIDHIFIPFFTAKDYGTGIGLSLSKRIIQLHHGQIKVHSELGKETVFTITF